MTAQVATLGSVNFTPVSRDPKATLDKIEATVREAAAQGIDLLAFPECAMVGCEPCDCAEATGPCDYHLTAAELVPGPATERIARLAAEFDMYVIFGMAERDADDPRKLYNAAAMVGPEGVMGTYRKVHLGSRPWVTEGITYAPGDRLPVWPTRFGPVGILICYDFWLNPELSRILALKGARLIVNSAASFAGPAKRDYIVHVTEVRALENQVFTLTSNFVGGQQSADNYGATGVEDERHAAFAGHSCIAGPAFPRFSEVLAEAADVEEIVSATVNFTKLDRWRAVYPWREWRRGHQRDVSQLIAKEFGELC
jgi:predicted amidohydrolase